MALGAGGGGGGLLLAETGAPSLGVGAGGLASGRADMERNLPHLAAHAAGVGRAAAQILTVPLAGRIDRLAVHALVVGALRRGAAEVDVGHAVEWGQYDALGRLADDVDLGALVADRVLGEDRPGGARPAIGDVGDVEVHAAGGCRELFLEDVVLQEHNLCDADIVGAAHIDLDFASELPNAGRARESLVVRRHRGERDRRLRRLRVGAGSAHVGLAGVAAVGRRLASVQPHLALLGCVVTVIINRA